MNLTKSRPGTSATIEELWIRFNGTAETHGQIVWLKPFDDEALILKLTHNNVKISGDQVEVRHGATILNLAEIKSNEPKSEARPSTDCDGNDTGCIGAVEYCCHNGKVVGHCDGYYRC